MNHYTKLTQRFRGFLPVVIDIETGGVNAQTDALLEIALVLIDINDQGKIQRGNTHFWHVLPYPNLRIDPASQEVTGIFDPYHPFRYAVTEKEALETLFQQIRLAMEQAKGERAILVGHNANFDLSFIQAACQRNQIKNNPLHRFSVIDTVALSALVFGETVLAKATAAAGIPFDQKEAHSAIYDAEKTADLFCWIVNRWRELNNRM